MRRAVMATAVLTTAVAATLTPTASSAAAPYKGANTAAVQDDFNGDGYRDLAVGAPGAANGSVEAAGAVVVLWGGKSTVSVTRRTVITQATTGIPGNPEQGDRFGETVASADLDRDGYADLLIGSPSEAVGNNDVRGSVTVVWGGSGGLRSGVEITPPAGYGKDRTFCGFGTNITTGDMNGDGAPELTIGSRCEGTSYTGPFKRTGKAAANYLDRRLGDARGVVMGDVDGDGRAERFWLPGPTDGDSRGPVFLEQGPPDESAPWENKALELPYAAGHTGRIGDINGDGYGDLVTGIADDESLAGTRDAAHRGGEIQVLYGSAQGITAAQRPKVFHQDTPGVPGSAENADMFGQSLSIGDVNKDGYADVLIGSPNEGVANKEGAGTAVLLRGSARGLTTAGATGYTENTAGVPDTAEAYDGFGTSVHLADLNRDGRAETVVGIPGENMDGCLWLARGSASGPVVNGSHTLCGRNTGITVHLSDALFGTSLTSPYVYL
ncbi:FG-GAP-like repeat-containing protein [Streptomyces sp. SID12501]|uniref:VCBS repeat-containing protein n=1 Tax=Streptomyces sp. SID12501 TaxID=2706042 RepID=A0A6B3C4X3_9ACTN|nr:FG-GAP-like repeat-containing protein [Streptomyces sp. SID12501]NEC91688.1 hypothetical protein [Streptomyces sp. SID12501]